MVRTYWKRGRKKMQKFLKEVKKLRGNPYIKMGYPKEWSEIREKKAVLRVWTWRYFTNMARKIYRKGLLFVRLAILNIGRGGD